MRMILTGLLSLLIALPVAADPSDDLLDALRVDDMLEIMREEGLQYGEEMADEMFASGPSQRWSALVSQLYDTQKMYEIVRGRFDAALDADTVAPLLAYYLSEEGKGIVDGEIAARRAMVSSQVEEAARESFRSIDGTEDPRLEILTAFVDANDLIESNVTGALNASLQFYRGLVEGGALEMGETEILRDVWSQEAETRMDTREWLFAYLLLAYDALEPSVLDGYVELSKTDEGQAMNRALFAGFNRMYDDLSFALGLAAAQQMQAQEL